MLGWDQEEVIPVSAKDVLLEQLKQKLLRQEARVEATKLQIQLVKQSK